MPVPVLSRVGNYELIRPLGAGGMAQTFLAVRRGPAGFEQKVCVKRILPEYVRDHALVEQFLDEARLLAHLRHASIVQVYDFGEADGSYFMALELVEGVDLEVLLRFLRGTGRELPASVALHLIAEVLNALHYAHNAQLDGEPLQLVHRDISPSNILLSRNGEVKVTDFGIAKSRQRTHKTKTGYTKGKVAYMSPEQVRGEELDARSDLFAVGVMLHELITGVHPFDAPTDMTLLGNILAGKRPPLATLVPDLRADLIVLVDSLLATDREQRPATAMDSLRLVPSLERAFVCERQMAALVTECMADRELPLTMSTPELAHGSSAGGTTELGEPTGMRQSTSPRVSHGPSRPPSAPPRPPPRPLDFTDDLAETSELATQRRRTRSSAPLVIGVLVSAAVATALWLGYRSTSVPPVAATPNQVERAGAVENSEPAATPPEARAPQRPVRDPSGASAEGTQAGDDDDDEAAPQILHAPEQAPSERGSRRPTRAAAEPETVWRKPGWPKPRAPKSTEAKAVESKPAESRPAEPAAPAAQPAQVVEPKPKHRTGISVSADEF